MLLELDLPLLPLTHGQIHGDIKDSLLIDPTNGNTFGFAQINALGLQSAPFGSDTTRPGYGTGLEDLDFFNLEEFSDINQVVLVDLLLV